MRQAPVFLVSMWMLSACQRLPALQAPPPPPRLYAIAAVPTGTLVTAPTTGRALALTVYDGALGVVSDSREGSSMPARVAISSGGILRESFTSCSNRLTSWRPITSTSRSLRV